MTNKNPPEERGGQRDFLTQVPDEVFIEAVERAGHCVYITDEEGVIEYANPVCEEVTGYSRQELTGESTTLLSSDYHEDWFYDDMWGTIHEGEVWEGEIVNETKEGERYVVHQTISPILEDSEVSHFVAVNEDVTELKKYRRELERQTERLEEFIYALADETANHITVAQKHLSRIEGEENADAVEKLDEVHGWIDNSVKEVWEMVTQGQRVEDPEWVSLRKVSEDCWQRTKDMEGAPALEIEVPEKARIKAERNRLRTIIKNLIQNAAVHTEDGVGARIGLLEDGFYFEDDGPGILPQEREDMLSPGKSSSGEDTLGFGLSVVREAARAHGWELKVTESEAGGARFEVTGARVRKV